MDVYNQTTLQGTFQSPDGDAVSLYWFKESLPAGSNPIIGSVASPTVTFDQAGDYVFRLVAEDARGGIDVDSVSVRVNQTPSAVKVVAP